VDRLVALNGSFFIRTLAIDFGPPKTSSEMASHDLPFSGGAENRALSRSPQTTCID
jgi:hypothetical protein